MTVSFRHLLVAALRPEWDFLTPTQALKKLDFALPLYRFVAFPNTALLQTGPGQERNLASLQKFLERFSCESLLHFGTCGGLNPEMTPGDLFLASSVVTFSGNQNGLKNLSLDCVEHSALQNIITANFAYHSGSLLTSNTVLKNRDEKCAAKAMSQASAVDMESFGLANLCHDRGICYLSLRGVFDTVDENLESLGEPYDEAGDLNTIKISRNLLKNPKLIFTLPDLKKRLNLIQKNLKPAIDWYLKRSQNP